MPFKSQKQRAWMFANHPKMAKEFSEDTPKRTKPPAFEQLNAYFDGGKVKHSPSNPSESSILVDDASDKGHVLHRSPSTVETTDDKGRLHNFDPKMVDPEILKRLPMTQGPDPEHYYQGGKVKDEPTEADKLTSPEKLAALHDVRQANVETREMLRRGASTSAAEDEERAPIRRGYADGGEVPGKPKHPAEDRPDNDDTMIVATPGEIVLPLSVTQAKDAPEKAKKFVLLHKFLGE